LMETLKAAEGRTDVNQELMDELEGQPAPGDVEVDAPGEGKVFGVPDPEDPDPFGVRALEKEGLEIRDAATHSRPSSQVFEYHPSPTSPTYNRFYRRSIGTGTASNRDSYGSIHSGTYTTSEASTQTEPVLITSITGASPESRSIVSHERFDDEKSIYEDVRLEDEYGSPYNGTSQSPYILFDSFTTPPSGPPPLPARNPIT
jgi:hypothetical protein